MVASFQAPSIQVHDQFAKSSYLDSLASSTLDIPRLETQEVIKQREVTRHIFEEMVEIDSKIEELIRTREVTKKAYEAWIRIEEATQAAHEYKVKYDQLRAAGDRAIIEEGHHVANHYNFKYDQLRAETDRLVAEHEAALKLKHLISEGMGGKVIGEREVTRHAFERQKPSKTFITTKALRKVLMEDISDDMIRKLL